MKKERRLLELIGEIDEKYIDEAALSEEATMSMYKTISKKPIWIKWVSVAACFTIVAIIGVAGIKGGWFDSGNSSVTVGNGDTINFVKSDMAQGSLKLDMDITTRKLTAEEIGALFGELPVTANTMISGTSDELLGIAGEFGNVTLLISVSGQPLNDTVIVGNENATEIEGVPVIAGYFVTEPNSRGEQTVIYYADFELGESKVHVDNSGLSTGSEAIKKEIVDVICKLIANGELDTSKIKQ